MKKIIALVGPTASGKSELAVFLAKKFKGEIISADSRQIYKGMDIGTGKVAGKWVRSPSFLKRGSGGSSNNFIYKGVPHHCIDFLSPKKRFSSAQFKELADKVIIDVLKRDKLPIICGGTAHWIDAVVYNQLMPEVKPNLKLRSELDKLSLVELFARIRERDPNRAKNIDAKNKRRLIRALEIILATGKPVPQLKTHNSKLTTLFLGITWPQEKLYQRIEKRLKQRLKAGMVDEVKKLHKSGLSWKALEDFGLEYRFISQYLQKKISKEEMILKLSFAIKHYSKRQLTWWKRNTEIKWIKNEKQADKLVDKFLK